MSYIYKDFRVEQSQYSDSYIGCGDCIHEGDKEEICKLRECVHAFYTLRDCYIPKVKEVEE